MGKWGRAAWSASVLARADGCGLCRPDPALGLALALALPLPLPLPRTQRTSVSGVGRPVESGAGAHRRATER